MPIHINDVKHLMRTHTKEKSSKTPQEIIETVSKYYNHQAGVLAGKTRRQDIVHPRQVCIYVLREFLNASYQLIGENLGGRDHTTIMHSYEKMKKAKDSDPQLNKEIEEINQILNT